MPYAQSALIVTSKFRNETGKLEDTLKNGDSTPETVNDGELRDLLSGALSPEAGLRPLSGFKMDFSANPDFRKVFFSAKCDCGTSALLSVEVAKEKTRDDIIQALPSLVERLESQARVFHGMPCEMHTKMRMGPLAGRKTP